MLSLGQLSAAPALQPRTIETDVSALQASIAAEGLLSALVVRPAAVSGKFEIVAGNQRFRALTALKWKGGVPCLLRSDLQDDNRAFAVAVAENSEDARSALSLTELGRACQRLLDADWTLQHVAKETGCHPQRIRRATRIVSGPPELVAKVTAGEVSQAVALDILKLPTDAQLSVIKEAGPLTTGHDIRALRKQYEAESKIDPTATAGKDGAPAVKKTPTSGAGSMVTLWRGNRDKQKAIAHAAYVLVGYHDVETAKGEPHTADYYEMRGVVAHALWDRGDLESFVLPSDDSGKLADKKANEAFLAIVRNEAARHDGDGASEDAA